MARLIAFSGLPGVGKTTLARQLAARIKAVHLRVDTVEAAMMCSALGIQNPQDAGYLVLSSVAKDNLRLGLDVIVDTVNSLEITRKLWAQTAEQAQAGLVNIEVICSDLTEHRQRIEARVSDIEGLRAPNWQDVLRRDYTPWTVERIIVDTATTSSDACCTAMLRALEQGDQ